LPVSDHVAFRNDDRRQVTDDDSDSDAEHIGITNRLAVNFSDSFSLAKLLDISRSILERDGDGIAHSFELTFCEFLLLYIGLRHTDVHTLSELHSNGAEFKNSHRVDHPFGLSITEWERFAQFIVVSDIDSVSQLIRLWDS
jgi:hypothetical protein